MTKIHESDKILLERVKGYVADAIYFSSLDENKLNWIEQEDGSVVMTVHHDEGTVEITLKGATGTC